MLTRRPALAFCTALCLWAPSAMAFTHGNLDLVTAAVRFLLALAVSWIGVTVLATVVAGYGSPAGADGEPRPRRRATDPLDADSITDDFPA